MFTNYVRDQNRVTAVSSALPSQILDSRSSPAAKRPMRGD